MDFTDIRNNTNTTKTKEEAQSEQLEKQFDNSGGLRLRFPRGLEEEFQSYYAKRYNNHTQISLYMIFMLFLGTGILDFIYMPDLYRKLLAVRLFISFPMLIAFLFSMNKKYIKYQQITILFFICITCTGMLSFTVIDHRPYKYFYSFVVPMIQIFAFVSTRIFFSWSILCTGILFVECNIAWLWIDIMPGDLVVIHNFNFITGSLFSLATVFLLEQSLRKNYLDSRVFNLKQNDLEEANVQLKYLIALDGLTGIANRRTLDKTLNAEWQRGLRNENPIAFLLIDIDYFKQYNDTYGHQAGDDCLIEVSKTIQSFARRPGDLAARYGGEEFSVILSNTELIEASIIATRILHAIEGLGIPHRKSIASNKVTVSIGLAVMIPQPDLKQSQVVAYADKALYTAKEQGRNIVAVSEQ